MTRFAGRRLGAVAAAVGLAALGVVGLGATSANAVSGTVTVPFRCETTIFSVSYDQLQSVAVTLTAPSTVHQGDPLLVDYSMASPPTSVPVPLTNAVVQAAPSVLAEKSGGGSPVTATGLGATSAPATIAPYTSFPVPMPVALTFPTSGWVPGDAIDLTPQTFVIDIVSGDDGIGGGVVSCTPEPSSSVALTVHVIQPSGPLVDHCVAQLVDTTGPPGCSTQQELDATVTAGSLSQQAYATGSNPNATIVNLGSLASPVVATALSGAMNRVRVSDSRGGSFGWSLTGSLSNFSDGPHTINKAQLSTSPSCVAANGASAPGMAAGPAGQSYSSTVTLCTKDNQVASVSGSSGGQYDVNATLSLLVPSFQIAGTYSAVLTITLA